MKSTKLALRLVSKYDGFYSKPPLDHNKLIYSKSSEQQYELVCFCNDGGEVWLGRADKWHTFMKHNEFLKICLWYLYQRSVVDFFGLRTWLYYKLLSASLRGIKVK